MTLRIAIDASAVPAQRVGAGVYVAELLRALDRLDLDLHVFAKGRDVHEFAAFAPKATMHAVRLPNRPARLVWSESVLPMRIRRLAPDVFHGPHYTLPAGIGCPAVVTFHDPTFFTMPGVHERSKVQYFTRAARAGIRRAARVVAVSEYARRGAIDHAGASSDRVDVVHSGIDPDRYRPSDEVIPFEFEPYVLFVGALEPRKDVPSLIGAFDALAAEGLARHLVIVGPRAWGAGAVDAAAARVSHGAVHQLAYVDEYRKIDLYRRASLFVYPSLAEGFGLPVLEAMACGTPVVTTTGSAPEEIAGDAALCVAPGNNEELRAAMSRVLGDADVAADLRRRGLERASQFTWTRTAEATVDVWRRALA